MLKRNKLILDLQSSVKKRKNRQKGHRKHTRKRNKFKKKKRKSVRKYRNKKKMHVKESKISKSEKRKRKNWKKQWWEQMKGKRNRKKLTKDNKQVADSKDAESNKNLTKTSADDAFIINVDDNTSNILQNSNTEESNEPQERLNNNPSHDQDLKNILETVLKAENDARNIKQEEQQTSTEDVANRENVSDNLIETEISNGKQKKKKKKPKKKTNKRKRRRKKKANKKKDRKKSNNRKNLQITTPTNLKPKPDSNSKNSRKTKRCNWYKRKVQFEKRKMRNFKNVNCDRAKDRGRMSYNTLWTVYNQLFDTIHYNNNLVIKQISNYKHFLKTVTDFLEKNTICSGNPQWNKVMIEVNL